MFVWEDLVSWIQYTELSVKGVTGVMGENGIIPKYCNVLYIATRGVRPALRDGRGELLNVTVIQFIWYKRDKWLFQRKKSLTGRRPFGYTVPCKNSRRKPMAPASFCLKKAFCLPLSPEERDFPYRHFFTHQRTSFSSLGTDREMVFRFRDEGASYPARDS